MAPKLMIVMRPVAGGMWEHLLTLLDGLDDEYEPVVCCQDDPEQLRLLASRSVRARVVPMPGHIRPFADARAARLLRRAIIEEQPAIVHSHGFHAGLLTALVAPFAGRPPHVCTLHNMAVQPGSGLARRLLYGFLQWLLVVLTPRVITVSEAVRNALPTGRRARNIIVISNGIDPRRVRPAMSADEARRQLDLDGTEPVVGCVARLAVEKGVDDFVRMAGRLTESRPEMAFVLVGDGPMRKTLQALGAELGLGDRMRFVGEHFPAVDFMQVFDVTVIPSILEGQSLAAIESLFLGKPVVCTEVGGLAEVVTPEVGRLVRPRHPEDLARAVCEVLDSGQASRMGARGRDLARSCFTAEKMVARTKDVYRKVTAATGDAR